MLSDLDDLMWLHHHRFVPASQLDVVAGFYQLYEGYRNRLWFAKTTFPHNGQNRSVVIFTSDRKCFHYTVMHNCRAHRSVFHSTTFSATRSAPLRIVKRCEAERIFQFYPKRISLHQSVQHLLSNDPWCSCTNIVVDLRRHSLQELETRQC